MFGDESNDVSWNGSVEVIELRLLAEDRGSMLEVGKLDIDNHAPLEP
jgi:hypothetical protein